MNNQQQFNKAIVTKNVWLIIIIIIVVVFIIGSSIYLYSYQKSTNNELTPESIIKELHQNYFSDSKNIIPKIEETPCVYWTRENDISFGLIGWTTHSARPDLTSIKQDKSDIVDFLTKQGFEKNEKNTQNLMETFLKIPGEEEGYEKESTKCVISWTELTPNPNLRKYRFGISCANQTPKTETAFNSFYPIFDEYSSFCVEKERNGFAAGYTTMSRWFAIKQNGNWKLVWGGQDYPPCSKVESFPEDFYEECLDY